jgi:crossover junction endodeoxyribonuclease RuvC
MTLLALDLGTDTGYALSNGGVIVSGSMNYKPKRYEGGGMRYLRFKRWLDEIHASVKLTEIVFEEVRRHRGTDAAHVYGGFLSTLTSWCEENDIPYSGVPVQAIKKFATGKGNADKVAVIQAVQKWGFDVKSDDEADAIALLRFQCAEVFG